MLSKVSIVIDEKKLALLQVDKNQPGANAFVDIESIDGAPLALQRALQERPVDKSQAILGIPHHDLILRSFIVPEMSPGELNKAMTFEIKKYIPFSITEAYYSTLTFPFVEAGNKMMRVVFYAVRKTVVERYTNLLQQAGLTVTRCEPAICGLVRMMVLRKDIHPADKIALLDIRPYKGIIYFIDAGVVKFVREIPLSIVMDAALQEGDEGNGSKLRFLNEVHNSFDFYFRQFNERVKEMLVVADDAWFNNVADFVKPADVKCRKYSFTFASGLHAVSGFPLCCAFGLGLTGSMFVPPIDFLAVHKTPKKSVFASLPGLQMDIKELVPVLRLGVGMAVAVVGIWTLFWIQTDQLKKQLELLISQQAEFATVSVEELQNKITQAQGNFKALRQVSFKSNQHQVLLLIAQHMPPGMWLQDVSLNYNGQESGLAINIKAAVYVQDVNQQVKAVNAFLLALKTDKELAGYTSRLQLKAMNRQQVRESTATFFELSNG